MGSVPISELSWNVGGYGQRWATRLLRVLEAEFPGKSPVLVMQGMAYESFTDERRRSAGIR